MSALKFGIFLLIFNVRTKISLIFIKLSDNLDKFNLFTQLFKLKDMVSTLDFGNIF